MRPKRVPILVVDFLLYGRDLLEFHKRSMPSEGTPVAFSTRSVVLGSPFFAHQGIMQPSGLASTEPRGQHPPIRQSASAQRAFHIGWSSSLQRAQSGSGKPEEPPSANPSYLTDWVYYVYIGRGSFRRSVSGITQTWHFGIARERTLARRDDIRSVADEPEGGHVLRGRGAEGL